jgi:CHAT domain-containing protein
MHAGAPRVVVSLWKVDDQATSVLMQHFYREMLRGRLAPAAALRAAQRRMRADPAWRHPFHWAGFVLQGEWRAP